MAIRGKHVQDEIRKAEETVVNSLGQEVIIKLITVGLKLLLTIRLNQVKIMEKLGVDKIKPRILKKGEMLESGKEPIGAIHIEELDRGIIADGTQGMKRG